MVSVRQTKNHKIIKEATDLLNELEYVYYKAPSILQQLKEIKFTKKKEGNNIEYLIDGLEII
jgi:hypothetical protein|nr:MAG TPA: hypothetical protein [Caudoviricetes sp.]